MSNMKTLTTDAVDVCESYTHSPIYTPSRERPDEDATDVILQADVNDRSNTSQVRSEIDEEENDSADKATLFEIEDVRLLQEIARLPMSMKSPRLVPPSSGDEVKAVKVMGLKDDDCRLQFPTSVTTLHLPIDSTTALSNTSLPLLLQNEGNEASLSTETLKPKLSTSTIAAVDLHSLHEKHSSITMNHMTPPDTVRKRRGFRPLSVITSALFPFEFDPVRTMEAVRDKQVKNPKLKTKSSKLLPLETIADLFGDSQSSSPITDPQAKSKLPLFPSNDDLLTPVESNDKSDPSEGFQISPNPREITAINTTIKADFTSLLKSAPPDLNDHPAFRSDPFSSTSDSPLLVTTSTAEQIREWARHRRHRSSTTGDSTEIDGGSAKKEKFRLLDTSPSDTAQADRLDILAEGSPSSNKTKTPRTPLQLIKGTITPKTEEPERKRSGSGGLRHISSFFKSRTSLETISDSFNPPESKNNADLHRPDLEHYIRKVTNTPSIEYSPGSMFPRHPVTSRDWKSRNLRCTNCATVCCAVCGRACCAYRAAVLGLENHKDNPPGREVALRRMIQITHLYPYGKETPTFIQCTYGGNGCGKLVCPDCCGVCPVDECGDTQCRRCKSNPWAECSWHLTGRSGVEQTSNEPGTSTML